MGRSLINRMEFIARLATVAVFSPIRALSFFKHPLQDEYDGMSPNQINILKWAYLKGSPYGFQEIMPAIAWQESSCGNDLENKEDGGGGSWGIFGNQLLATATYHFNTWPNPPTPKQMERARISLIEKPNYAAKACIAALDFWRKERDSWGDAIASYNAGWELADGKKYQREVEQKRDFLKETLFK